MRAKASPPLNEAVTIQPRKLFFVLQRVPLETLQFPVDPQKWSFFITGVGLEGLPHRDSSYGILGIGS